VLVKRGISLAQRGEITDPLKSPHYPITLSPPELVKDFCLDALALYPSNLPWNEYFGLNRP